MVARKSRKSNDPEEPVEQVDESEAADGQKTSKKAKKAKNVLSGPPNMSFAEIEDLVKTERAARARLPPPVATEECPLPDPGNCKFCEREFCTTNNPLQPLFEGKPRPNTKPDNFLNRVSPGSRTCVPCRNAQNWALKGVGAKDLSDKLKDEENRVVYIFIVFTWEHRYNNPQES